jgi:hypothetical protein
MLELPQIPDFKFSDLERSTLSNFKTQDTNWEELIEFLKKLLPFFDQVDIGKLIAEVLKNIQTTKIKLTISHALPIGASTVINDYTISRITNNSFEITNNVVGNSWNTSQTFVDIVDSSSLQVIRPIVTKNLGKLIITFNSNIENDFFIVLF